RPEPLLPQSFVPVRTLRRTGTNPQWQRWSQQVYSPELIPLISDIRENEMTITRYLSIAVTALLAAGQSHSLTAAENEVIMGPVGPSPYTIIEGWHKPFAPEG